MLSEFRSPDPAFSVNWLLGLQAAPERDGDPYTSNDPAFSVSWLLGLQVVDNKVGDAGKLAFGLGAAGSYTSNDPTFSINRLLGLQAADHDNICEAGRAFDLPAAGPYTSNDRNLFVGRLLSIVPPDDTDGRPCVSHALESDDSVVSTQDSIPASSALTNDTELSEGEDAGEGKYEEKSPENKTGPTGEHRQNDEHGDGDGADEDDFAPFWWMVSHKLSADWREMVGPDAESREQILLLRRERKHKQKEEKKAAADKQETPEETEEEQRVREARAAKKAKRNQRMKGTGKPSVVEVVDPVQAAATNDAFRELCGGVQDLVDDGANEDWEKQSIDGLDPEECDDDSACRKEWISHTYAHRVRNRAVSRLMSLPGLENVKEFVLKSLARVQAWQRRRDDAAAAGDDEDDEINGCGVPCEGFNLALIGNPGTGKSVAAKLYAQALESAVNGPSSDETIIEKSAYFVSRRNYYAHELIDQIKVIHKKQDHCSVIINDLHGFNSSFHVREWWSIFTRACALDKPVHFILTGNDEALSSVLHAHAFIAAKFTTMHLANYKADEMRRIASAILRTSGMRAEGGIEGPYVRLLATRVSRARESNGFANVWALHEALNAVTHRQARRLRDARNRGCATGPESLDNMYLTKEDVTGGFEKLTPENCPAWKELLQMIGLGEVKDAVRALATQVEQNAVREARGLEPLLVTPNRVFLGNPGTGKTTVARLYGQILKHLGILSKGELLLRNASDLLGRYVGASERNTKKILESARGNVLVIDDAYMLDPGSRESGSKNGDFRGGVLDVLVAEVPNSPGEDRCIILAGYRPQMEAMFQNANPGLGRRFPMSEAFDFVDYTLPQLAEILDLKLRRDALVCGPAARAAAMDVLERARDRPHFGNGAEVDNLLSKAGISRNRRASELELERHGNHGDGDVFADAADDADAAELPLEPGDFDPDHDRGDRAVANCRALFADMVGFDAVVRQFETYQRVAGGMRRRGLDPRGQIPFTFVFRGPPGTGKTTVARRVGRIFYDMGFLASDEVVECSATDLVGEYCGWTGPKVQALLTKALGRVLFVDEAYRLAGDGTPGKFEQQAIGELVDAVTKPQFAKKLVILLAGYDEDMDRLLACNQGLRSRFATPVEFPRMGAEQCLAHLTTCLRAAHITVPPAGTMPETDRAELLAVLGRAARGAGWASGRSVQVLASSVIARVFAADDIATRETVQECSGGNGGDGDGLLLVKGDELARMLDELVPEEVPSFDGGPERRFGSTRKTALTNATRSRLECS